MVSLVVRQYNEVVKSTESRARPAGFELCLLTIYCVLSRKLLEFFVQKQAFLSFVNRNCMVLILFVYFCGFNELMYINVNI